MEKRISLKQAISPRYFALIIAFIICFFSTIALAVNFFMYKFPGNNYLLPDMPLFGIILALISFGIYLLFSENSLYFRKSLYFIYFFIIVLILAYATTAIQFTPFYPVDTYLIAIDQVFKINLNKIMGWTVSLSWLFNLLGAIYNSLPYQMCYLPLALIILRKFADVREYYILLLLTCLFGFTIYYFFPTLGPASFIKSPYFFAEQYATGIKFNEIHHHISPSTNKGGLIALPSFHVIWAVLCLNLVRCLPLLFILLFPINLLLIVSCLVLGWHYFVDILASFFILAFSYMVYFYCVRNKLDSGDNYTPCQLTSVYSRHS